MQNGKYACRVFFEELLESDLVVKDKGMTFIITSTGARCNSVFGVGEVKEVKKRGKISRITLDDLTGSIDIYTNKQVTSLNDVGNKAFLAFIGSVHAREGPRKLIIIAEEIAGVEEKIRTNWILNTARRTMERIETLRINLSLERSNLLGLEEKESSRGFDLRAALEYYKIDDDKLDELVNMARKAITSMWRAYSKTAGEWIVEILKKVKSIERGELVKELKKMGVEEALVEEIIDELVFEGRCYAPEAGMLKVVEE
jgi:RPA family protein